MKKHLSLIIFFFITLQFTFSQTFLLTNGATEKKFPDGSAYKMILGEPSEEENGCCEFAELEGVLTAVTKDSFQMDLKKYYFRNKVDDVEVEYGIFANENFNYGVFAKSDIYSLQRFKSPKNIKRKANIGILGGILIFTGVATGINYFVVNKDSRKEILYSAGVQVGLGIVLASSSGSKKYRLKGEGDVWRMK